jgi:hypothetical protein
MKKTCEAVEDSIKSKFEKLMENMDSMKQNNIALLRGMFLNE